MLKRVGVIALCVITVMTSMAAAKSEIGDHRGIQDWTSVFKEFGLKQVEQVPPGVTPVIATSPGQIRKLLTGHPHPIRIDMDAPDLRNSSVLVASESLGLTESYVELRASDGHEWPLVFHLYAKVWIAGSGSFWEITDCNDRVYFTGWAPLSGHEDEWSSSHIAANRQSVEVEGGARMYGYIKVPIIGEIWLYSYRYHLTIDYSL